jgi:hypothetical protein
MDYDIIDMMGEIISHHDMILRALATIFRNFPVFNFSSFFDHDLSGARRRNPRSAQEDAHVCPCAHSRQSVPLSNTCPGTAAVSGVSNLLRGASSISAASSQSVAPVTDCLLTRPGPRPQPVQ